MKNLLENVMNSGTTNQSPENILKIRFINVFSVVGIVYLSIFAIIYFKDSVYTSGMIELCLACVGMVNFVYMRQKRNTEFAASVVLLIMICVLAFLLTNGGLDNTGLFWFFTFPALAFFLKGTKKGFIWLASLYALVVIIELLSLLNVLTIPYESVMIRQMLISLSAVSILIYFFELIKERDQKTIDFNSQSLKKELEKSEGELNKRKEAEEQLTEQNSSLEQTKLATLNILEDLEVEKARLKEEKDKIDTIIQSIGDAVFVVDKNLDIVLFNKVSEELSGYSAKEAIGKNYRDILKFEYEDTNKPNEGFVTEAISKGVITGMTNHTVLITKDGKKIPVSDSAAPIKDKNDKVTGCIVVFRDVTIDRDIDKAKTEFVSLASHQLRTPLTAIKWYIELMTDSKLSKDQLDFAKEIGDANQRMVDLVNSLLNVSRIDLGTFAIEPIDIDITEVAKSVIKEMTPAITSKDLKVKETYDKIKNIKLDPKLIRIVLQNLISNAVKYTPEKGEVDVSIESTKTHIKISIKDNGYGIPKKQQVKIFEKLFRADNIREKVTDGTGLGLYIVKSILDQSGGKISFESVERKGTTFVVEIPLTGMKKKEGNKELS